ncbi:MAG: UDP-glucuronic acid decarboxylase family protein [Planctomycetota bacterium]
MTRLRILVTGGAGFVGAHLCRELLGQGHDVICLDNFFTSQKSAVSEFLDNPHFELIRHDITHPIWLEVDQCYNLACPASPVHYWHNPIKTIKTSVLGAIHVLGMAKRTNARVLQASTSEVYGDRDISPQPESYHGNVNPIGVRSCYDEGKRCAEALFFDYHRAHKVDIRLVRIFNTYGPGMHPYDGRVVSNFILQALAGEDIEVHGDGSQTRSFCYVDDLVRGLMAMMNGPDDFHGPVNLGNPGEISMLELAEKIIRRTNSKSQVRFTPARSDDPHQRCPDITLAQTKLGWQPSVPLADGLDRTIDYFSKLDLSQFKHPTKRR